MGAGPQRPTIVELPVDTHKLGTPYGRRILTPNNGKGGDSGLGARSTTGGRTSPMTR